MKANYDIIYLDIAGVSFTTGSLLQEEMDRFMCCHKNSGQLLSIISYHGMDDEKRHLWTFEHIVAGAGTGTRSIEFSRSI